MNITTGKIKEAKRVVIYGIEKIGKTTLASKFPKPIFIDVEDGSKNINVSRMDKPTSWSMLNSQVDYIGKNKGAGYKTLVIDSADWAERLCVSHVCDIKGVTNLGDVGYGNGFVALEQEFGKFLDKLDRVKALGINIVVIAHSTIKKFEQPDEAGSYDRYELKMEKKTAPLVKEWCDMLLFANYKTIVVEIDGKKKAQGGKRALFAEHTPAFDAGNRDSLNAELPFEYKSIAHCIPSADIAEPIQSKPNKQVDFIDHKKGEDNLVFDPKKSEASQDHKTTNKQTVEGSVGHTQQTAFNTQLYDLMQSNNVTEEEIRYVVSNPPKNKAAYYPYETSIDIYDEKFVLGMLVAHWSAVFNHIKKQRIERGVK